MFKKLKSFFDSFLSDYEMHDEDLTLFCRIEFLERRIAALEEENILLFNNIDDLQEQIDNAK